MYKTNLIALFICLGAAHYAECRNAVPADARATHAERSRHKKLASNTVVTSAGLETYLQKKAASYSQALMVHQKNAHDAQAIHDIVKRITDLAPRIRLEYRQSREYKTERIDEFIHSAVLMYIGQSAYHYARQQGADDTAAGSFSQSMVYNAIAGGIEKHKLHAFIGARLCSRTKEFFNPEIGAQHSYLPSHARPSAPSAEQPHAYDYQNAMLHMQRPSAPQLD